MRCSIFLTAILVLTSVPGDSSTGHARQNAVYRVHLGLVLDFEAIRPLLEGCTDLGLLEPLRDVLGRAGDLESLRGLLEHSGTVRFTGCPTIVGRIPGVTVASDRLSSDTLSSDTLSFDAGPPLGALSDACVQLQGGRVVDNDGDYFGRIASQYASESIFNPYGRYGNSYSLSSIWNQYAAGSQYRSESPWNQYSRGLQIVKGSNLLGRLTVNPSVPNGVSPLTIATVCFGISDLRDPNS